MVRAGILVVAVALVGCANRHTEVADASAPVDSGKMGGGVEPARSCSAPGACEVGGLIGTWMLVEACETLDDPPEPCGFRGSVVTSDVNGEVKFDATRVASLANYLRALILDVPAACGVGSCVEVGAAQGLRCEMIGPERCECPANDRETPALNGDYTLEGGTLTVFTSSDTATRYDVCRSGDQLQLQRSGATLVFKRF